MTHTSDVPEPAKTGADAPVLAALSLGDLAQLCAQELHHLLSERVPKEDYNEAFALELFRRAAEGSADAWTCIFQQYALPVTTWLMQFAGAEPLIEQRGTPALVDTALMRSAEALTPASLALLPHHADLLRYLKMILGSCMLDARRAIISPQVCADVSDREAPAHVFQAQERPSSATQALWQAILAELDGEDERLLASLAYVQAMIPQAISSQFSDRFPTVEDVHRGQRVILDRVRQSRRVQDLLERLER